MATRDAGQSSARRREAAVTSLVGRKLVRRAFGAFLGGLVAGVALPIPSTHAQGFFEALFGSLTGGFRSFGRSYAPAERDPRFGAPDYERERPAVEARESGTMCVRLCDGRHFPVPRAVNGVALNPAKVCSSLCPAAQTQVFHGSNPAHAVSADGTRYTDLENAFVYRERVVPNCSCTGQGPGGLAQIDIESDPTLRAGDIVATPTGLTIFRGSSAFPYKSADFTPIDSFARVNADLRRKLSTIKVDPTATPATPVQSLANAEEQKPASRPRRRAPPPAEDEVGAASFPPDHWFR